MSDTPRTFVLKQKIASMSGDAWIEDEAGQHAYEVDGRAFHLRRTIKLNDVTGNEVFHISRSLAHLHRTFEIKRDHKIVATIQQGLFSIGDKFTIKLADGGELKAKGDIIDHDFEVRQENDVVIRASHALVSAHDTYGVQVMPGFPPDLAMALMIALEQVETQDPG